MKSHPTYEILEEIGRGSLATVYRARDLALKRYVAIKELHEKFQGDARQLEQFWEEAQFLANLKHDNIVQIHGLDKERGWIVMELMKGSLDAKLAEGALPADLVRSVLRQTLSALGALHNLKKFHGAVKPANLLIDDRGRVKLSDSAGIALSQEIRRPTGSAKYLAPELLNPEFGEVGTQVDLYCLGLAALELLKGGSFDKLFKGVAHGAGDPELAWMRWHSSPNEQLPPAKELLPSVPGDLAVVIDKLLKKHVNERYATAAEALKDLEEKPLVLVEPAKGGPARPAVPTGAGPAVQAFGGAPPAGAARPPAPAAPKTAAATHKDKPRRWSRPWLNEQVKKPAVLGALGGAFLLLLLLCLLLPGSSGPGLELTVDSDPPGASVRLNGNDLTDVTTPGNVAFQGGENKLLLKAAGYADKRLLITIQAEEVQVQDIDAKTTETIPRKGAKPTLKFALTPLPGTAVPATITVLSDPPDADVYINGALQKPAANHAFTVMAKVGTPAEFVVKVAKDGYESPPERKVQLEPRGQEKVDFGKLALSAAGPRTTAKFFIASIPKNAQVFIDGKLQAKTTDNEFDVPIGGFQLQLVLPGYQNASSAITASNVKEGSFKTTLASESIRPLLIATKPAKATVVINGRPVEGKVTNGTFDVPKASFKLQLQLNGYVTKLLSVGANLTELGEIELTPLPKGKREMFIASLPPGGSVWIDNVKVEGQKTDDLFLVPVGPFKLKVELEDKAGATDVNPDVKDVKVGLEKLGAGQRMVWIASDPPGASVFINEKPQVKKTDNWFEVPASGFKLKLVMLDKSEREVQVDPKTFPNFLDDGIKIEKDTDVPPGHRILIATNPAGAKVFMDGKDKGLSGTKILQPEKKFTLRIEKEGFFPYEKVLEPSKDDKLVVDLVRAVKVTIATIPGGGKVKVGDKEYPAPAKLVLPPGNYEVTGSAKGYMPKVEKLELVQADEARQLDITLIPLQGEKYALLAGVRAPTRDLPDFVHAGADVEELGRVFQAGGFDPSRLSVLTQAVGKAPTAQQLRDDVAALAKKATIADTVIVALAGHTVRLGDDPEVYFCPADADLTKKQTLLPLSQVFKALQDCRAINKLVLLDVCRFDAAADIPALPAGVKRAIPGDIEAVPGLAILASCSGNDPGYEYVGPYQRHGVFFQYVIRGLLGAAGEGDKVSPAKLVEYVLAAVPEYSQKGPMKTAQTPRLLGELQAPFKDAPLLRRAGTLAAIFEGLLALEGGKYDRAIEVLTEAEKEGAFYAELFTYRAAANYLQGAKDAAGYKRALDDCNLALKVDAKNAKAFGYAGEANLKLAIQALRQKEAPGKFYTDALGCHDKEIELEPGCSLGYENHGLVRESQARDLGNLSALEEALADFGKACSKNVFRVQHFIGRGLVLKSLKEYARAIPDFDRAIVLSPQNSTLYYHRAWLQQNLKEPEKAIGDLDQALQLEKQIPAYWNLRGICRVEKKDFDGAIGDYTEAYDILKTKVKLVDGKVEGDAGLARALSQILVNRALAIHKKAVENNNDEGLLKRALEDYNQAVAFDVNSYQAYFNRAGVHSLLGNRVEAEKDLAKAKSLKNKI